jgi:DnaK suppressor protein
LAKRDELVGVAERALSGDIHVDPDDFPDEMDTASSEVNLQFTGRLREREQGLLSKIDAALEKIDRGSYGECVNCGEDIGIARLRARPVAELCIESTRPFPYQVDGDYLGETRRLRFQHRPEVMDLVFPLTGAPSDRGSGHGRRPVHQ